MVGDALAFVNVTANFLNRQQHLLLPSGRVILELVESEAYGPETELAVRAAVEAGFKLALHDLVSTTTPGVAPFLPLVSVVRVDVHHRDDAQITDLVAALRRDAPQAKLLAEKVETIEVFDRCRRLGFDLFQGYFFAKPDVL